jgi:hypothetical protein
MISMLEVDDRRKRQEVDLIAGNDLFRELQERSRRLRASAVRQPPTDMDETLPSGDGVEPPPR